MLPIMLRRLAVCLLFLLAVAMGVAAAAGAGYPGEAGDCRDQAGCAASDADFCGTAHVCPGTGGAAVDANAEVALAPAHQRVNTGGGPILAGYRRPSEKPPRH